MNRETIEATVIAASSKATYTGAGTSLFGWWLSSEALGLFGVVLGALGFLTNLYFRHRQDRREELEALRQEREHHRRMALLKSQPGELQ